MDWSKFDINGESKEKAFETLSNQIFKAFCENEYKDKIKCFVPINGSGGDGGIESYVELKNGNVIAIQSKCFFDSITSSRIAQIRKSIKTAQRVRKNIIRYIVSIPRDLANKKNGVKNSEREKIENLFNEFSDSKIKFELWGEFELLDFLTNDEKLAGVYRFWFKNSEISFNTIKNNFELQKNSWLKNRYNENLHVKSNINYEIEKLMGNLEYKRSQEKEISEIQESYRKYIELFEKIIGIVDDIDKENLTVIYNEQKIIIDKFNINCSCVKEFLKNENVKFDYEDDFYIKTEWFFKLYEKYKSLSIFKEMHNTINLINYSYKLGYLKKIKQEYNLKNLVIYGDLGTGKTHGVVNQVQKELSKNNVAIFIRASDVDNGSSWKEILTKQLGLSNTWTNEEVFVALESLAHRNQLKNEQNDYIINNKVLICIDGIDEHSNYEFWSRKQQEAIFLSEKYERVRFCFIGRKYAFGDLKELDKTKCRILNFDTNPGHDINKMYNKYINEYKIKFGNSINVKPYLTNPLVLKLFCEQYENQKIDSIQGINVNLSQLFRIKLEQMNKEFIKENKEILCEDPISRSARIIVDYLYKNEKISKNKIIEFMNNDDELNSIINSDKFKLIKALQKYKLLDSEIFEEEFGKKKEYYHKGMQPVVDYIMAINLSNEILNEQHEEINKQNIRMSVWQLTALILLEENDLYLPDFNKLGVRNNILERAMYYAIANANPLKANNIKNKIRKLMLESPENMREILNKVIIPCAKIEAHPLGTGFLNDILNTYEFMAERDKVWSLPEWLENDKFAITEELIINEENPKYFLNKNDRNDGLPMIYSWLLTRTKNMELYFYRNQLMKWAIICPKEFILLLKKFSIVNDIQILEQLFGIAMCLAYKNGTTEIVEEILKICDNTFFDGKNIKIYNFQIRTYIRAVAEKAHKIKILNKKELKKYLPPYKCEKEIQLCKDAAERGNRMGGYEIIDYDLSRYVLCDFLDYRFFDHFGENKFSEDAKLEYVFSKNELIERSKDFQDNEEYKDALASFENEPKLEINIEYDVGQSQNSSTKSNNNRIQLLEDVIDSIGEENILPQKNDIMNWMYGKETKEFLKKEAKKIGLEDMTSTQFILSSAYQFILNCGWNKEETYIIDSEIIGYYHKATHGAKSGTMCLAEKYIWCYRNEIIGYLADNLYKNKDENKKYDNYAEIDDVLIPVSELEQNNKDEKEFSKKILVEDIFYDKKLNSIEEMKKWIQDDRIELNLDKWIYIENDECDKYITLDSFNSFSDIKNELKCNMWISAGIIKEDDMLYLKDSIKTNQEYLYNFVNGTDSISEYTITNGAKTPFEIVNFDWFKQAESQWINISLKHNKINRYNIMKAYESAYNTHTEFVEVHYKIPSYKVRKLMRINDNEEFKYKYNDDVVAFYETNNKSWNDFHDILAVKRDLEELLRKDNEKLIWFFRIDKELSYIGRKRYNDIYDVNTTVGICWFENEKIVINILKSKDNRLEN